MTWCPCWKRRKSKSGSWVGTVLPALLCLLGPSKNNLPICILSVQNAVFQMMTNEAVFKTETPSESFVRHWFCRSKDLEGPWAEPGQWLCKVKGTQQEAWCCRSHRFQPQASWHVHTIHLTGPATAVTARDREMQAPVKELRPVFSVNKNLPRRNVEAWGLLLTLWNSDHSDNDPKNTSPKAQAQAFGSVSHVRPWLSFTFSLYLAHYVSPYCFYA